MLIALHWRIFCYLESIKSKGVIHLEFANTLRQKRKSLNITQQELADQLHVTRQTLSRWENNLSYPNLDTLVALSELLEIPLDTLLKGGESTMITKISQDVRDKHRYKNYLIGILSILMLFFLWIGILGYGRATQNETIDRFNPFLKTQYGYTILPKEHRNSTKRVDAYVSDSPFGNGSWLKFYTGEYDSKNRWALVAHKGSYVSHVRLISNHQIPQVMREQAGTYYIPYNRKAGPRIDKTIRWWPFD